MRIARHQHRADARRLNLRGLLHADARHRALTAGVIEDAGDPWPALDIGDHLEQPGRVATGAVDRDRAVGQVSTQTPPELADEAFAEKGGKVVHRILQRGNESRRSERVYSCRSARAS